MRLETLNECIAEAEKFIRLAKAVPIKELRAELNVRSIDRSYIEVGKASGAARRASMDLTRALADLRQGR